MINVLLTGAGFTANFGTPLAKDIYNILFNSSTVQNNTVIRDLFLTQKNISHSDYENIYDEILNSSKIPQSEKDSFSTFLWETFLNSVDQIDKTPQWKNIAGYKTQQDLFERFIVKLCNNRKSIFFTLNQDLFVERQLFKLFPEYSTEKSHIRSVLQKIQLPKDDPTTLKRLGVSDNLTAMTNRDIKGELQLPISETNKDDANKLFKSWETDGANFTFYIKLHGSLDFFYKNIPLLIAGKRKSELINNCPLTNYYFEIFKNILSSYDCRLIVIGYGFKDKHINDEIASFLRKDPKKNEIYIVENKYMNNFISTLKKECRDIDIELLKKSLKGYFPDGLNPKNLAILLRPDYLI